MVVPALCGVTINTVSWIAIVKTTTAVGGIIVKVYDHERC